MSEPMEAQEAIQAERPVRWSIKVKVSLMLMLTALIPMVLAAYYSLHGSLITVERASLTNLEQLAANVAGRLEQFIGDTRTIAVYLSDIPPFADILTDETESNHEAVSLYIRQLMEANSGVELVMVLNTEGKVVASSGEIFIGRSYAFRDYFQLAFGGETFVSNIMVGNVTGLPGMFFSRPVIRNGQTLGVIAIKMAGDTVIDSLGQVHGDGRTAFLVDSDGVLIHHPEEKLLYSSLVPVSAEALKEIQSTRRFMRDEIESLNAFDLGRAVIGAETTGNVRYRWPATGAAMIAGYAPVAGHQWVVVVNQPVEVFEGPLQQLFQNATYGVVLVGFVALLIAGLFARGIVNPILALTGHVRAMHGESFSTSADEGLDTLAKRSDDEVGRLAREFRLMQRELQRHLRHLKETTAAKERIESELSIARDIQMGILPKIFPPFPDRDDWHCEIFAHLVPAKEVGGDLYDFAMREDGRVYFVVGDVSGKGVPASLFMAVATTLLRARGIEADSPEAVLAWVNNELSRDNDAAMFVTVFCGFIDTTTRELVFANGGHNPPLVISGNGSARFLDCEGGMAVGVIEDAPIAAGRIVLEVDDTLLLYTDGVTEAMDVHDNLYSEERLQEVAAGISGLSVKRGVVTVMDSVEAFAEGAPQADDITLMSVRMNRTRKSLESVDGNGTGNSSNAELRVKLCNDLAEIGRLADDVEHFGMKLGLSAEVVYHFNLAFDELITNTISYGYDDQSEHFIEVRLWRQDDLIHAELIDDGKAFNPFEEAPEPDLDASVEERAIGGLGVFFVKTIMDEVGYWREADRNHVLMSKRV